MTANVIGSYASIIGIGILLFVVNVWPGQSEPKRELKHLDVSDAKDDQEEWRRTKPA